MFWQILILILAFLFSLLYYLAAQTYLVSARYQKFYIHPAVSIYKSLKNDFPIMAKWELILAAILYSILFLPITIPYFIIWIIYSTIKGKFIFFSEDI